MALHGIPFPVSMYHRKVRRPVGARCCVPVFIIAMALLACTVPAADMLRLDFNPRHAPPIRLEPEPYRLLLNVPRAERPPALENAPDDPMWALGALLEDEFNFHGLTEPRTWVRLLYDDDHLYLLAYGQTVGELAPSGTARARHERMPRYQEDIFHFVFSEHPGAEDEILLLVNAAGSIYDEQNGDERWDGEWRHAVRREADGWYAAVAVPFQTIGLEARPQSLGFNVGRSGPRVMIRSWFNDMHFSTRIGMLQLGAGAEGPGTQAMDAARPPSSPAVARDGESLGLYIPRQRATIQDRWLEATLSLQPRAALADSRLEIALFSPAGTEPLARLEVAPPYSRARLSVDMRRHGLEAVRLVAQLVEDGSPSGMASAFLYADPLPAAPAPVAPVEILLDTPDGHVFDKPWPVTFGLPFARGTLWGEDGLRVVDGQGRAVPFQVETTATWAPEGAIQWLRFDALVDPRERLFIEAGAPSVAATPLNVKTLDDGSLLLDTGVARYRVGPGRSPVREIEVSGRPLARLGDSRGLYVIDQQGREAFAAAEGADVRLESAGPVSACVRIEGDYVTSAGEALARHITRIEVFAGHPFAQVTHTLVITCDTNELWFREVGWELEALVGSEAKALLNVARDDPGATVSAPLAGEASVVMLQREHRRFGAGEDRFEVAAGDNILARGAECGDWAMLQGAQGALLMGCVESARQHPKEFEVFADRMVLRLFSPRAGEELDFRGPALKRKWNLQGEIAEAAAQTSPNAAGWSKTHQLFLAPLPAHAAEHSAAKLAALRRQPVYALADPQWIFASDAMGPLAPHNAERYPEIEALIERIFEQVEPRGHATGHYGFVDYFAGPTYSGGSGPCRAGRYGITYGLRSSLWLAYARSGQRELRAFAEGTNRAFMDNYLAHWDAPAKVRGLFNAETGPPMSQLPYYWGAGHTFQIASSTNLEQFRRMFHLTGDRRAGDIMRAFADGLKQAWTPHDRGRPLMSLRVLAQSYAFTWDPLLRVLAEEALDALRDSEGEVLLTKNRHYGSSTYKTREDVRGLLDAARIIREPKFEETATAVAAYWWREELGSQLIGRMRALPHVSGWLYDQTRDPLLLAGLEAAVQRAGSFRAGVGTSALCSVFESLPYALGLLAAADQPPAPWVLFRDYGYPAAVVAEKTVDGSLNFAVQPPRGSAEAGRQFSLGAAGSVGNWGRELDSVKQYSVGAGHARVPKDAPAGAYRIEPLTSGEHFIACDSGGPLVLYAPEYWHLPDLTPPARIFFSLPEHAQSPQVLLEGRARIFTPQGEAFGDPQGVRGWVDLPADIPGLWSFEPIENRLVRVRNLPPFFAFGDPGRYFSPPIAWAQDAAPERKMAPRGPDSIFVPGAGDEHLALWLPSGRRFIVDAGPAHPSGIGGQFLPCEQGTIEFFFKPDWHTFDLADRNLPLVSVQTDASPWNLVYRIDPEGTVVNLGPRDPSHSLYGGMRLGNNAYLRYWLTQRLFERGEWVHIAWSWGREPLRGPHGERLYLMTLHVYVNGRGGRAVIGRDSADELPAGAPQTLVIEPLRGTVAGLRISDVQRYAGAFEPPDASRPWRIDRHTRALFSFNETLEGQSYGYAEPVPGRLSP